jgi:hypothetical protein
MIKIIYCKIIAIANVSDFLNSAKYRTQCAMKIFGNKTVPQKIGCDLRKQKKFCCKLHLIFLCVFNLQKNFTVCSLLKSLVKNYENIPQAASR